MTAEVDDAAAVGSDVLTDCMALYCLFSYVFMAFEPKGLYMRAGFICVKWLEI